MTINESYFDNLGDKNSRVIGFNEFDSIFDVFDINEEPKLKNPWEYAKMARFMKIEYNNNNINIHYENDSDDESDIADYSEDITVLIAEEEEKESVSHTDDNISTILENKYKLSEIYYFLIFY